MTEVPLKEAYLLGCLFGRGSVEVTIHAKYQLIFRIPFREYSPVMVDIVEELSKEHLGLKYRELLEIPKVKAHNIENLRGTLMRLKKWHPPGKMVHYPLIAKEKDRWKIRNEKLVKDFFRWQDIYHERETIGITDYVLKHLRETATFLATSPRYDEEIGAFGIVNHIIRCEITPHTFMTLKEKYGIEEGDIYRHARIPRSISNFPREALEEFIRGLADTIATIDVWLDLPRIQFSVINENWGLPVDICLLLQTKLGIPVFYIEWAGEYMKRGGRDHLVKSWVINFDEEHFSPPLYYNKRKQEEFLEYLKIAKRRIRKKTAMFGPCPLGRRKTAYMNTCRKMGCPRVSSSSLKKFFKS